MSTHRAPAAVATVASVVGIVGGTIFGTGMERGDVWVVAFGGLVFTIALMGIAVCLGLLVGELERRDQR